MSKPREPEAVKLFIAALFGEAADLDDTLRSASNAWGPIDFRGDAHDFDVTDYYAEEMGSALSRCLVSFRDLVSPDVLPAAKLRAVEIEDGTARDGRRVVNLDVGYLDHNKVVLASTKAAGQKIWLRDGIWADLQGRYARGRYRPFDWTFPDFATGRYDTELVQMRKLYLQQRSA